MFENEAGKYVEKDLGDKYLSSVVAKDKLHAYKLGQYDGFIEGANFGFNKAIEWHYVNKEGLPEDKYKLLVQYVNGDYDIAFNLAGTWRGTSGNELRGAYAWKEIIPPIKEMSK